MVIQTYCVRVVDVTDRADIEGMWRAKSGFLVGKSYVGGIKWNHLAVLAFVSKIIVLSKPVASEHDRLVSLLRLLRGGGLKTCAESFFHGWLCRHRLCC